jgi:hypothetical protein
VEQVITFTALLVALCMAAAVLVFAVARLVKLILLRR